jgi:hypothetical protein
MAMNCYAVPRMTRDIDRVITLPSGSLTEFVRAHFSLPSTPHSHIAPLATSGRARRSSPTDF